MKENILNITKIILCSILYSGSQFLYAQDLSRLNLAEDKSLSNPYADSDEKNSFQKPLDEVLKDIELHFNIYFNFDDEIIKNVVITDNQSIQKIIGDGSQYLEKNINKLLHPLDLKAKKIQDDLFVIQPYPNRLIKVHKKQVGSEQEDNEAAAQIISQRNKKDNIEILEPATQSISGNVYSKENSQELPGVNIVVKGSVFGTISNSDGSFNLKIPGNATLTFSSVGYFSKEIQIQDQQEIIVELTPDIKLLKELVVVGYGTQERMDVISSIASINGKKLENTPINSVDRLMQGKAAGVHIITSQVPGGGAQVRVRGSTSINAGNEPLYVVDGIPIISDITPNQILENNWSNTFAGNPLSDINPNDIASIEILKDAAALSIYGARAANGVVLITTKRGLNAQTNINYQSYTGIQEFTRQNPLLSGPQAKTLILEAISNNETESKPSYLIDPEHPDFDLYENDTDFVGTVLRDFGTVSSHNLSLRGGDDYLNFAVSGGYFQNKGIIKGSEYQRLSLNTNLDIRFSDKVFLGNSLKLSRAYTDRADGVYATALKILPYNPLWKKDSLGNHIEGVFAPTHQGVHPLKKVFRTNELLTKRITNNIFLDIELLKGLNFRTSWGLDYRDEAEQYFMPAFGEERLQNKAKAQRVDNTLWINENTLSYQTKWADRHKISGLIGYSLQQNNTQTLRAEGRGASTDRIITLNASAFPDPFMVNGSFYPGIYSYKQRWGISSFFGRLNYNYADKYLLSFNLRRDGSSRFGKNNRYAIFPSFSLGWRISQEEFMKALSAVNDFKLRASFGQTGNQNIGDESAYAIYATNNGYLGTPGLHPQTAPVPGLSWENTTQFDLGFDLTLWNSRVMIMMDYYRKNTRNLLLSLQLPATSGYSESLQNVGEIENQGLELSVMANLVSGSFNWNINGNISANKNVIKRLPGGKDIIQVVHDLKKFYGIAKEGEMLGNIYGWDFNGVFAYDEDAYLVNLGTPEEPVYELAGDREPSLDTQGNPLVLKNAGGYKFQGGDAIFTDLNQDGIIDDKDRKVIGRSQPLFFGGFESIMGYKNFELSTFWQYQYGAQVMSQIRLYQEGMWNWSNANTRVLNRWRKQGDITDVPKAVFRDDLANNSRASTRFLEDGSFLRLQNVTLSYNLTPRSLSNTFFKNIKVFVTGTNLITFTRYLGNNPETLTGGIVGGIDFSTYPITRTITGGINLNF
ncbi:MAG: SusC/RagA family TonB-linked outer membrane protein [Candidatus Cyclobacteriaceae bacterium M3_2C_046]